MQNQKKNISDKILIVFQLEIENKQSKQFLF